MARRRIGQAIGPGAKSSAQAMARFYHNPVKSRNCPSPACREASRQQTPSNKNHLPLRPTRPQAGIVAVRRYRKPLLPRPWSLTLPRPYPLELTWATYLANRLGGDAFAPGAGALAGPADTLAGPTAQEFLTTLEALALQGVVFAVGFGF